MAVTEKRTSEQRHSERKPLRKHVEIVTGMGPNQACDMLDVSTRGARLVAMHGWSVPDVFLCVLRPGLDRWCRVVWRADSEVGVEFVDPPASLSEHRQ